MIQDWETTWAGNQGRAEKARKGGNKERWVEGFKPWPSCGEESWIPVWGINAYSLVV
jgi:hypothetical protein